MEPERERQPGPTPAERRAFRLLPLVWIVVLVLAGIILYAVFR
jgi:peptidoglycan/LPS O-acetylase OafA/YrhL